MSKKILLLGHTGKVGSALFDVLSNDYIVTGKNSKDFNALNSESVRKIIEQAAPDIVINTVAFLGIDPCEQEPEKALKLNSLFPMLLAKLSGEFGFTLVHFSTDAVFNDDKKDFYVESDRPQPLNVYGLTKYGGDCFIQARTKHFYIIRISVMFGTASKNNQFVEKMLLKIREGQKSISVSSDIIGSPSYSKDIAVKVKEILDTQIPFGLYHVVNSGATSLYDLMNEIVKNLNLSVEIRRASFKDFPFIGIKNTYTPIKSEKIAPLRAWQSAAMEYCEKIKKEFNRYGG